jgi:cytochrome P450 monooxygenase
MCYFLPNAHITRHSLSCMEFFIPRRDSAVNSLVCIILAVTLGILYPKWQRYREIRALKQRHGCKDPPKYPHEDKIMGSDMVRARQQAMREGRFFHLYSTQFQQYGKTFEEIWRGRPLINTIEPANVQQVAALAFEDYGKDPERAKAQGAFFGPGIFSDGPVWKKARALVKPIFAKAEISDLDHLASYAIVL